MKKRTAMFSMIIVSLVVAVSAQDEPEPEAVSLPDYVMKRVVERIVIDHFQAGPRRGEIYFSEQNIKREWLPAIRKISFVFVTDADGREVHFFEEPVRIGETYQINFGWGDPNCSASGDTWQFKIVNGEVRDIAQTSGGWGSGCSASQ